jgi:hypothetical protein
MLAPVYIGGIMPLFSLLATCDSRARTLMRYYWNTMINSVPREVVMRTMTDSGP